MCGMKVLGFLSYKSNGEIIALGNSLGSILNQTTLPTIWYLLLAKYLISFLKNIDGVACNFYLINYKCLINLIKDIH